jgi:hypothetical protein
MPWVPAGIFRPRRDSCAARKQPSDESLGYFRASRWDLDLV